MDRSATDGIHVVFFLNEYTCAFQSCTIIEYHFFPPASSPPAAFTLSKSKQMKTSLSVPFLQQDEVIVLT